jgi:hypothetical protein
MRERLSDLEIIKENLLKEAFSQHMLLESKETWFSSNLSLAKLLLLSACFGVYRLKKLVPAGLAIELLNLAVENHYYNSNNPFPGERADVLKLIGGDYFYAKGIQIASSIGDTQIVKILVEAIADIADFESHSIIARTSDSTLPLEKSTSLFRAAARIGSLISNCPKSLAHILEKFAHQVGVLYKLRRNFYLPLGGLQPNQSEVLERAIKLVGALKGGEQLIKLVEGI